MFEGLINKLSLIPKELVPALSIAIVVIAVFLTVIFFALCVVYVNTKPPSVIKKTDKKTAEEKKKPEKQETKVRFENLPMISGRLGEILTLNGILSAGPITIIFFRVLSIIKNSTYDIRWRYNLPFFMLLGAPGSGKRTLLNNLSLERLSSDVVDINPMWRLFKVGAVFNAPKTDRAEDEKTFWSFLSELFLFIRPRRPLDGLIVTLPVNILLSEIPDIEKHAFEMFEKIFTFQKEVNFRLPIYLIVTKSDLISGFTEFSHLLKERTKQQMFGWSNPYTLETAFSPLWFKEMFETINKGIRCTAIGYAKEKTIDENLEKALLFENNFRMVEAALSLYLSTMFRSHNPVDGLLLRGVYFTGKHKETSLSSNILKPSALSPLSFANNEMKEDTASSNDLCFVHDVFSEKIFKEHNIAHPIRYDTIDISKKVFQTKLIFASAVFALTLGWFFGNNHISKKIHEHHNMLNRVRTMLTRIKRVESDIKNPSDQAELNMQVKRLLHSMPSTGRFDFFSPFVLQSWFSDLHKNIVKTMGIVFDAVIIRAMYIDLNVNTHNMLTGNTGDRSNEALEQRDMFDVTSFPSFRALQNFASQISSIQTQSSEYNALRRSKDRKGLISLMANLFKDRFEIADAIISHIPNKKLMPPQFNLGNYQEDIESYLSSLFNNFVNEVFNGIVEKVLQNIADDIKKLEDAATSTDTTYITEDLAKLYQKTILFVDVMKNKHFAWIAGESFAPAVEYVKLVNSIHASGVVSENLIRDILRSIEARFRKFKTRLRDFKTTLTDNIINENLTNVSEEFKHLQKELKVLLDQSFICITQPSSFTTVIPADKMLLWDVRRLQELSSYIDKYEAFKGEENPDIRTQFIDKYKIIARKCFEPMVIYILGNAQLLDDLPLGESRALLQKAYQRQATNIRNATVQIVKIARFFGEVRDSYTLNDCEFTSMIVAQYSELLQKIDNIFTQKALYFMNDELFKSWTGKSGKGGLKFLQNIRDDVSLQKFITAQLEKIRFLAKDLAAPVVELLEMPHITEKVKDRTLINKWRDIIASVTAYEEKKPGNSLAALEEFLLNTLRNLDADSLSEYGDLRAISQNNSDFFMQKRASAAKALMSRTELVSYEKAAANYNTIRNFFNTNLANRFPFAGAPEEVTIDDIEAFVRLYEQNSSGLVNTLEKGSGENTVNPRVFDFLTSLNRAMPLLRGWVTHARNSNTQNQLFTFDIVSRPDAGLEVFTSALLEREITIRGVVAHESQSAVFNNNDEVDARFTWVNNADERPYDTREGQNPNLRIRDNAATFSYRGRWAMFRLIEEHKVNKDAEFPNGILVEFRVPLLDRSSANNSIITSKIVMRIIPNVKIGDIMSAVTWPVFPKSSPNLHINVGGAQ